LEARRENMDTLISYIENHKWNHLFRNDEGSHIISHTYNVIKGAFRDGADRLILTSNEFIWTKELENLGRFPVTYPVPPKYSFRKALIEILERDEFVKKHLMLVSTTEDEIVCKLTGAISGNGT
jgi:hypothetical protein